jgi:uncharacterized protein (TIGR02246 family)
MDESQAVAALLARDEIRQLPYRYAKAIEARDVDAMIELYSPNARFGTFGRGPEGLRWLMTQSLEESVFAVSLVANHIIELDGDDEACGEVWAHCFAQTRVGGYVEQLIRYDDRYVRSDGRWRFLHRKHRLWYGVRRQSPLRQPPANWPASQVGVGDIPLADKDFQKWWAEGR